MITLDDKWTPIPMEGIYVECCTCALTHEIDFKEKNGKLYWKWKRNERHTTAARKKKKLVVHE